MSLKQRQGLIDREHRKLSLVRQCALLGLSRAWWYYQPTTPRAGDLELMALMDRQYLKTPTTVPERCRPGCGDRGTQQVGIRSGD
jgi:hypothetical protein